MVQSGLTSGADAHRPCAGTGHGVAVNCGSWLQVAVTVTDRRCQAVTVADLTVRLKDAVLERGLSVNGCQWTQGETPRPSLTGRPGPTRRATDSDLCADAGFKWPYGWGRKPIKTRGRESQTATNCLKRKSRESQKVWRKSLNLPSRAFISRESSPKGKSREGQ